MSCKIVSVSAPNGAPSKLWNSLLSLTEDASRAMHFYLAAKRAEGLPVDESGEPTPESVIPLLDLTEAETLRYLGVGSDFLIATGATSNEVSARVEQIEFQIQSLRKKLRPGIPAEKEAFYRTRIEELHKDKQELLDRNTASAIEAVATRQIDWAREIIRTPYVRDEEMVHALQVLDSWKFAVTENYLNTNQLREENPINKMYKEIGGRADAVSAEAISVLRGIIKENVNRDSPIQVELENLMRMEEIGFSKRYLFDISKIDNRLVQHIDGLLKRSSRNQAARIEEISRLITEKSEGVNMDSLLQRDENGKHTGKLITEFAAEFFEEKKEAEKKLTWAINRAEDLATNDAKRLLKRSYRKYYANRNKAEIFIDPRDIDAFTSSDDYALLVQQVGAERAEEYVAEARTQVLRWQAERLAFEEQIESDVLSGRAVYLTTDGVRETGTEYKTRVLAEYDARTSPLTYAEERTGSPAEYRNREGFKRIVTVPRGDQYYDEAFRKLTDKEKAFYEFVVETMDEMKSYLPAHKVEGLESNFLAVIQKDLVEQFSQNGLGTTLGYLGEKSFEALTSDYVVQLNKKSVRSTALEIDPNTGQEAKRVPIRFTEDGAVPVEDRSFNIPKLVEMFSAMALNYKFKTDVEDSVQLAYRVLKEAAEIQKEGEQTVMDRFGNLVTQKNGLVNLKDSVAYAIDAMLYNEKRVRNEFESNTTYFSNNPRKNTKSRAEAKRIESERDSLEDQLEKGEISEDDYKLQMSALEDEYEALGGRNLVWGKVGDSVLAFTQMKGMGYNVLGGLSNIGFGLMSNVVHAAGRQDFDGRSMRKAFGVMLRARTKPVSKVAHAIKKFNIMFEVAEIQYGKNQTRRKYKYLSNLAPFEIQRRTEFMVQGHSLVSQMVFKQITVNNQKTGKEETISLWDAFDENMEWKTELYGPQEEYGWDDNFDGAEQNEFTKFRDKAIQVNKVLHGNYDPNSPMEAKKHVLGRMMLMFRSWMPEGFAYRFQREYYDAQLGRNIKGRWRSYADLVSEGGIFTVPSALWQSLLGKDEIMIGDGPLNPTDAANMRQNLREMQMWLGLFLFGIMLKMGLDDLDDDDPAAYTGKVLLNQIHRIEQDIHFYINPRTFTKVVQDPVPAIKTFTDFMNAARDTVRYMEDEEYRGDDPFIKWGKTIPVTNQLLRVGDNATEVFDK